MIKNRLELASNSLREAALQIIEAGLHAIDPEVALQSKVSMKGGVLLIGKEKFDMSKYRKVFVVGIGKASFLTAKFLERMLGDRISDGVVIDVIEGRLNHIRSYKGTHPLPTEVNIRATNEVIKLLSSAGKRDLVIAIISGGGSSLLCQPNKMTCISLQQVTEILFKNGADIKDMNTLRKHISKIHGGNLAKIAYPATVASLIFSDVPFNDLSFVASGPTYPDKTTKADAEKIVKKYDLPKIPLIDTPKDQKYFDKVSNTLVLSNKVALKAMKKRAEELGFPSRTCVSCLKGEARLVGARLISKLKGKKAALIAGGETIVFVKKKGKGGRNLEVVLGALSHIRKGEVIISIASDGKDHIKEAAGAIGDMELRAAMEAKGYDPEIFLNDNRSFDFFVDLKGVIVMEPTGSNVSDLVLILRDGTDG
ncbi:MAG: DUF4147 domain-containing protein [Candidatus Colwellbacteria bacterium]|nr:DUF4147 domain-containing protein [Candidatus Colwellbacteria bacterium]